jgi:transposase InsO family protein
LLRCEALHEPREEAVRTQFERVVRAFGLPARIRSDNGSPFATQSPAGLSALSVWWIKLGIVPERIDPGHPEQNGRHERMHRTLKAEATRPAATNLASRQRVFDEHELPPPHYGDDVEVRWAYANGAIGLARRQDLDWPRACRGAPSPDPFLVRGAWVEVV